LGCYVWGVRPRVQGIGFRACSRILWLRVKDFQVARLGVIITQVIVWRLGCKGHRIYRVLIGRGPEPPARRPASERILQGSGFRV